MTRLGEDAAGLEGQAMGQREIADYARKMIARSGKPPIMTEVRNEAPIKFKLSMEGGSTPSRRQHVGLATSKNFFFDVYRSTPENRRTARRSWQQWQTSRHHRAGKTKPASNPPASQRFK